MAITLVSAWSLQGSTANYGNSASLASPAVNVPAGALIVTGCSVVNGVVPSVSDTAGNTYTVLPLFSGTATSTQDVYVAYCLSSLGNTANVVTWSASGQNVQANNGAVYSTSSGTWKYDTDVSGEAGVGYGTNLDLSITTAGAGLIAGLFFEYYAQAQQPWALTGLTQEAVTQDTSTGTGAPGNVYGDTISAAAQTAYAISATDGSAGLAGGKVTGFAVSFTVGSSATPLNLGAAQAVACSIGAASLALSLALSGAGIGNSVGSAQLAQTQALSAQAHGASIGSASLAQSLPFSASGRGSSVGSASLSTGVPLSGSGIASSAGSTSLALMQPLSASGLASSVGQTTLAQSLSLAGLGNASSIGAGSLTVGSEASLALGQALVNASSIGSAQLSLAQPMQATAQGSSLGSTSLSQQLSLAATAQASSIGSASLKIAQPLTATANASSGGHASLTLGFPLFGLANASSSGSASLTLQPFAGYAFDPNFYTVLAARNFYGAVLSRTFYAPFPARNFYAQPKRNMPAIVLPYAKDPREVKTITLDATADLPAGATLTGITSTQITVTRGNDPSPSAAFGTPVINSASITVPGAASAIAANMAVQIPATGGVDGCWYEIAVTCTTSASPNTETLKAVLMVSAA